MKLFFKQLYEKKLISDEKLSTLLELNLAGDPFLNAFYGGCSNELQVDLMRALAEYFDFPMHSFKDVDLDADLCSKLSINLIKRFGVIPLQKKKNIIEIAILNPFQPVILFHLEKLFLCRVNCLLTTPSSFNDAFARHYHHPTQTFEPKKSFKDNSNVAMVDDLLKQAVQKRASDLHFEYIDDFYCLRLRVDGVLTEYKRFTLDQGRTLGNRLKILANIDVTENRRSQEGRFSLVLDDRQIDLRLSSMPTVKGEKIVIRVLDQAASFFSVHDLGFSSLHSAVLKKLLFQQSGMILICGPTGSGKTSTLYSFLNQINTGDRNIVTVEDPVEYQFDGLNQTSLKPELGLTFSSGLKALLRQDPDVILLGDIREADTASTAMQSALTGHLVFSTLHANSACSGLLRLFDFEQPLFLLKNTISAIISQRLIRKLCRYCKREINTFSELSTSEKKILSSFTQKGKQPKIFQAKGCSHCLGTGYYGRMALFEFLIPSSSLWEQYHQLSLGNFSHHQSFLLGKMSLKEDAYQKWMKGLTSFDEIVRILGDDV